MIVQCYQKWKKITLQISLHANFLKGKLQAANQLFLNLSLVLQILHIHGGLSMYLVVSGGSHLLLMLHNVLQQSGPPTML